MSSLLTLARPYAKAVFNSALRDDAWQQWGDFLKLAAQVTELPQVKSILTNPKYSRADLHQLLVDCVGKRVFSGGDNLLKLLLANKRIQLLPQIFELFSIMQAEHEQKVDVEMVTAFPLSSAQQKQFVAVLAERLQRRVTLQSRVDGSLLGGAIIRAGDKVVIDGSVRGQLTRLSQELMNE